jgi:hypothetical protein
MSKAGDKGTPLDRGELRPYAWTFTIPTATPADTPSKARRRSGIKFDLLLEILADIKPPPGLQPAEIERKVLPEFHRRWAKLGHDGDTGGSVSRRHIYRAYQEFLHGLGGRPP